MYKAYEAVPAELKARLTGAKALHIHEYKRTAKVDVPDDLSKSLHYFHPVFTTHPDTGRKTLFVDRLMTARIEGVSASRKRRDPRAALCLGRAARVHLRACLAPGRRGDVGQSLHHSREDMVPARGEPPLAPLHRRGRAAFGMIAAFEHFLAELRAIWSREPDMGTRMALAQPLLQRLVLDPALKEASSRVALDRGAQEPAASCR